MNQLLTRLRRVGLMALVLAAVHPAIAQEPTATPSGPMAKYNDLPIPKYLKPIPRLTVPVYVMEYHVWYNSPFGGDPRPGYLHWGPTERADTAVIGPDWMRDTREEGYPLLGLYNSEDADLIRWQIQCMKRTGIAGAFVQLFPEWNKGLTYNEEHIWKKVLAQAAKQGFHVALHDEVQFRRGQPAQKPDVMAQRLITFLKKYADKPGYLRIDGKPAVAFQFWDRLRPVHVTNEQLAHMMDQVEKAIGEKVYWIVFHAISPTLYRVPEVSAFVTRANSNRQNQHNTRHYDPNLPPPGPLDEEHTAQFRQAQATFKNKDLGLWLYPGFNNSPYAYPTTSERHQVAWMSRRGGRTFVDGLRAYKKIKPAFIMISSWNDWIENTAIEPGWSYDGFAGDPYLYCRILAAANGKTFTPPPLPPKESVDPLLWQPLYGIDRIPPRLTSVRYLPLDPAVVASFADSAHPITGAWLYEGGDVSLAVNPKEKLVTHGITSIKALGEVIDGGVVMKPRQSLTLHLQPTAINAQSKAPVYIAVEYTATQPGRVILGYPSNPPTLGWKPDEERRHLHPTAQITLQSDDQVHAAVRMLRGFDRSARNLTLTVTVQPPHEATNKTDGDDNGDAIVKANAGVTITRLELFVGDERGTPGVPMSNAPKDTGLVRTYRFDCPSITGERPRAMYLVAGDSEGNRSAPQAVMGSRFSPLLNLAPDERSRK